MNIEEVLKDFMKPLSTVILDESVTPEVTVKAINESLNNIDDVVTLIGAHISKEVTDKVNESVGSREKEMKSDFDTLTKTLGDRSELYFENAYSEFLKEHKEDIINSARVALVEGFVDQFKVLFNENSIEVDMESKNQVETLSTERDNLRGKLDESLKETMEWKSKLKDTEFNSVFASVKSDLNLTESQSTALKVMSESYACDEKLDRRLRLVADTLLKSASNARAEEENTQLNEDGVGSASIEETGTESKVTNKIVDPLMDNWE